MQGSHNDRGRYISEKKETEVVLVPILPSSTARYDERVGSGAVGIERDEIDAQTIVFQIADIPPEGWAAYISPEGDTYFNHTQKRIVTRTSVRSQAAEQRLFLAHARLVEIGRAKDPHVTEYEAYLHIKLDTSNRCEVEYYFVDTRARHPFWVHKVSAKSLGLQSFGSAGQLKSALTAEYWVHIEGFPVHQAPDPASESELVAIIRHGCTDDMTSTGATFPYDARECRKHLKILEGFISSDEDSGYRTATFARLWASVSRVRHINRFGLPGPRLDRHQGLNEFKKPSQPSPTLKFLELLLFSLPVPKYERLTELWNGRIVFQRHWHVYFADQRAEWIRVGILGVVIFLADVLLIQVTGIKALIVMSTFLAAVTVFSALLMHETHSRARFTTAPEISSWISTVEDFSQGLMPVAIKFAIPQAAMIYSATSMLAALLSPALGQATSVLKGIAFSLTLGPALAMFILTIVL